MPLHLRDCCYTLLQHGRVQKHNKFCRGAEVVGRRCEPSVRTQTHIARAKVLVIAAPGAINVRQMIETVRSEGRGTKSLRLCNAVIG